MIVLKCIACYVEVQLVKIAVMLVMELKCMVNGINREVCCASVVLSVQQPDSLMEKAVPQSACA